MIDSMNLEALKWHNPTRGIYMEHKLVLDLLEQTEWIPVSEKLPDLDKYSHGKIWKQKVLITGYYSFDSKKELFVSEEFANNVINDSARDIVVLAWMPLPKPYKAESEVKE